MKLKSIIRSIYRSLPFKRFIIYTMRALGFGVLLSDRLKTYLVFEGPFSVPTADNTFLIENGYGRDIESLIFWNGIDSWEGKTLYWWRILTKRSKVIIDVGANTGLYSLIAKSINPSAEVHAFEPLGRIHSILNTNISLNNSEEHATPIFAHRIALSDYNGDGQMFDLPVEHMYTASLNKDIHKERGNPTPACTENVKVQRLDHFLDSQNYKNLDLIKIDVESHEPYVLRGLGQLLQRYHPSIIVEIWNNDVGQAIESVLAGCKYHYFAITNSKTEKRLHISNEFPDLGYLNYLIITESVARELGLLNK
jgi:FkbM family methyltransferase